jgi:hypothetical protein
LKGFLITLDHLAKAAVVSQVDVRQLPNAHERDPFDNPLDLAHLRALLQLPSTSMLSAIYPRSPFFAGHCA